MAEAKKDKTVYSKGVLQLQIASLVILVLVAFLPLAYILNAAYLSFQMYLADAEISFQPFNISILYLTLFALTGALALLFILFRASKLIQKRWQHYQSLEIETERVQRLLENNTIEDDEDMAMQNLSAKAKLDS